MEMLKFLHPGWLFLLALVPLLFLIYLREQARFTKRLHQAVDPRLVRIVSPRHSPARLHAQTALTLLSIILVICAASWPLFGAGSHLIQSKGIDLVVAIDVSKSMFARDVFPSRLERSKAEVKELLKGLSGDRVGIIVFAGEAFIQCPLTTDYDAVRLFLNSVDRNSVPQPGTSLRKTIEKAMEMLRHTPENAKTKILAIITDGEDHEGEAVEQAKKAAAEGVAIFTIGIGSPQGEPVPDWGENNEMKGYKKNREGETVLSKLNETLLKQIAAATGGKYIHAGSGNMGTDELLSDIKGMAKSETQARVVIEYEPRFRWFLIPAFAFLTMAALIPLLGGIKKRSKV